MAIYSKKMSPAQKKWARNYQTETGFEPMYQEDFDAGKISFERLAQQNIKWFEDWFRERMRAIDLPFELCEELLSEPQGESHG